MQATIKSTSSITIRTNTKGIYQKIYISLAQMVIALKNYYSAEARIEGGSNSQCSLISFFNLGSTISIEEYFKRVTLNNGHSLILIKGVSFFSWKKQWEIDKRTISTVTATIEHYAQQRSDLFHFGSWKVSILVN